MRINQVQHNYNPSFKAYFKKDSNGYFERLFEKTTDLPKLNKLTKQLKENCPNHELEIIGEDVTEEKVITWRDSIPSYQYYLVRNNNNGNSLWICAPSYYVENHLISVVDTLAHSDTELLEKDAEHFWLDKDKSKEILDELTTPNTNPKLEIKEQNYDDLSLKAKIKSFFDFWFKF